MNTWDNLADEKTLKTTAAALIANGIDVQVTENKETAKAKTLELLPPKSEVMTMTSATLDSAGITQEINRKDGNYMPVRDKLYAMDRNTQAQEMNRMGATPNIAIGSVHAVTEDGHILIASNTGSQLPAYAYGALKVILVVGTQKIVKNIDEGMKRIYEYTLPLESERAKKAYGVPGSSVNKILIINKEGTPGRITIVFVKENLGY
ncbi:MAG: LUD domain-containing protein [Patescibacteria group bacterium]